MTNATVLADALVEAEIITRRKTKAGPYEWFVYSYDKIAEEIIKDWRVAGKVLEILYMQMQKSGGELTFNHMMRKKNPHNGALPLAIIEAWYEARQ